MPPPRGPESRIGPIETPRHAEKTGIAGDSPPLRSAESTAPAARSGPGPALWIATAGGVGFGPWAPGTWGALVAVLLFSVFLDRLGPGLYAVLLAALTGAGIWASSAVEEHFGRPDDGRIVIDEVVGQLIALAPLVLLHGIPLGRISLPASLVDLRPAGIDVWWLLVVTGFVAFRWFDIRKPGPVRWAEERFEGGAGVMADDIVAGLLAAFVVTLPAYLAVVARLRAIVLDSGMFAA